MTAIQSLISGSDEREYFLLFVDENDQYMYVISILSFDNFPFGKAISFWGDKMLIDHPLSEILPIPYVYRGTDEVTIDLLHIFMQICQCHVEREKILGIIRNPLKDELERAEYQMLYQYAKNKLTRFDVFTTSSLANPSASNIESLLS